MGLIKTSGKDLKKLQFNSLKQVFKPSARIVLMSTKPQQSTQLDSIDNSLFMELIEHLISPESGRVWLQKIINLLKQYLNAKNIAICTFIDNLNIFASDDEKFKDLVLLKCSSVSPGNVKPFWIDNDYIVPLSYDARLIMNWEVKPSESKLNTYNSLISILSNSLKNRTDLFLRESNISFEESVSKIQAILGSALELQEQIKLVSREVFSVLAISRCQIKIFSQLSECSYDAGLSSEIVTSSLIEAISVIPSLEREWLSKINAGENIVLLQNQEIASKNLDSLLSIQSILGYPLTYKTKTVGTLVLHQCDYSRNWRNEELSYLSKVSMLLGILVGAEMDNRRKQAEDITDLNTGLINSEQLLRELNRLQIETRIKNSVFSLIMLDIEKLKDVNFKMGFVAGNLVLSQTARYIKRLYGDKYTVARYSNDEFVIILNNLDQNSAQIEAKKIKEYLSDVSVLGVGTVEYNFSFVTYPKHSDSIPELLTLLEQAMILSKSRGKNQISSFDEVRDQSKNKWQELLSYAIPEIIVKKSSLKTGPEMMETINKQITQLEQRQTYNADILDSIQSLAVALDAKDSYTEGHSSRVSEYAYLLAKEIGLDLQEVEWIRLAAGMHDIGKIGIPENILCKPGKLTKEEYEIMKKHPLIGEKILKPIKPLEKVAKIVLYHHEYWDGSGYPNGLMKEDIPIGSRIVSIVDAYQAMTSNRPYRASLPLEEAISRLKNGKESQWDSELVDMFIKIISK